MSADPTFDFGLRFASSAERVRGEAERRAELVARQLYFHHAFLDDTLRSILPNDLILIGAESGAGKTEIVASIAEANAAVGKRVHFFALEAEQDEIERRIKYRNLAQLVRNSGAPRSSEMNYADWYRGFFDDVCAPFVDEAEGHLQRTCRTLHTYYRGDTFGLDDIRRMFLAVQDQTDLIVLDHLHYVDLEDENENRAFKAVVKTIRSTVLAMGKPVILVAHLRKKNTSSKAVLPDLDSFHGSSDIVKICTGVVLLAPARAVPVQHWSTSNTFVYVPKDRMSGATGLVAVCQYDRLARIYRPFYALGRMSPDGATWNALTPSDVPRWALNNRSLTNP